MSQLSLHTKLSFCLPFFLSSCFSTFEGAHLTKLYIQDLCVGDGATDAEKGGVCLSGVQYGLITSLIGSLGLFMDLFISYVVDVVYSKYRSHLPCIFVGAPLVAICQVALFLPPQQFVKSHNDSPFLLGLWFLFFTLLKGMIPLSVSYNALGPNLTSRNTQAQRDELFAMKHMMGLIGGLVGGFMPTIVSFVYKYFARGSASGNSYIGNSYYVIVTSCLITLSYWYMTYALRSHNLRNADDIDKRKVGQHSSDTSRLTTEKSTITPLFVGIRVALANRAFRALLFLFLFESARGLMWNGLYTLYMVHVLQLSDPETYDVWMGIFNTAGTITALSVTPVWVKISKTLGQYRTWLLSYTIQVPIGILVYATVHSYSHIYLYLFYYLILSFAGTSTGFLLDSIKANVFDYDELRTGQRRESSLEAAWNFLPRYISLPGSTISFAILQYYGNYDSSKRNQIPPSATNMIRIQASLLPSVTSIICLWLMYRFPITDDIHKKVQEGIKVQKMGHPVMDPLTKEVLQNPKVSTNDQESSSACESLRNFFRFEIAWMKQYKFYKSHIAKIERLLALLWFLSSLFFFIHFVLGTILLHYDDHQSVINYFGKYWYSGSVGWNTFNLWASSVLFTICAFHYLRIDAAREISSPDFSNHHLAHALDNKFKSN